MTSSKDLAIKEGPYSTFAGSPVSQGIFQFDMWNVKPTDRWEWDELKEEVKKHGVRNSLLLAPMPKLLLRRFLVTTNVSSLIHRIFTVVVF